MSSTETESHSSEFQRNPRSGTENQFADVAAEKKDKLPEKNLDETEPDISTLEILRESFTSTELSPLEYGAGPIGLAAVPDTQVIRQADTSNHSRRHDDRYEPRNKLMKSKKLMPRAIGTIGHGIRHPVRTVVQNNILRRPFQDQTDRQITRMDQIVKRILGIDGEDSNRIPISPAGETPAAAALKELFDLAMSENSSRFKRGWQPLENVLAIGQTRQSRQARKWMREQVDTFVRDDANRNLLPEQIAILKSSEHVEERAQGLLAEIYARSLREQNALGERFARDYNGKGNEFALEEQMTVEQANPMVISESKGEWRKDLQLIAPQLYVEVNNKLKELLSEYMDDRVPTMSELELLTETNKYFSDAQSFLNHSFLNHLPKNLRKQFNPRELATNILDWERYQREKAQDGSGNSSWEKLEIPVFFGYARYEVEQTDIPSGFRKMQLEALNREHTFTRESTNRGVDLAYAARYAGELGGSVAIYVGGYLIGASLATSDIAKRGVVKLGGAAAGTLLLPGVGTLIGGSLGTAFVTGMQERGLPEFLREAITQLELPDSLKEKIIRATEGRFEQEVRDISSELVRGSRGSDAPLEESDPQKTATPLRTSIEEKLRRLPMVSVTQVIGELEGYLQNQDFEQLTIEEAQEQLYMLAALNARRRISDLSLTDQLQYHTVNLLNFTGIEANEGKTRWGHAITKTILQLMKNKAFDGKREIMLKGKDEQPSHFESLTQLAMTQLRAGAEEEQMDVFLNISGCSEADRSSIKQLYVEYEKAFQTEVARQQKEEQESVEAVQRRLNHLAWIRALEKAGIAGAAGILFGGLVSPEIGDASRETLEGLFHGNPTEYVNKWAEIFHGKMPDHQLTPIQNAALLAERQITLTNEINALNSIDISKMSLQDLPPDVQLHLDPSSHLNAGYNASTHQVLIFDPKTKRVFDALQYKEGGTLAPLLGEYTLTNMGIGGQPEILQGDHYIVPQTGVELTIPRGWERVGDASIQTDGFHMQVKIEGKSYNLVFDPHNPDKPIQGLPGDVHYTLSIRTTENPHVDINFDQPQIIQKEGDTPVYIGKFSDERYVNHAITPEDYKNDAIPTRGHPEYLGLESSMHWNNEVWVDKNGVHFINREGVINFGTGDTINGVNPSQSPGVEAWQDPHNPGYTASDSQIIDHQFDTDLYNNNLKGLSRDELFTFIQLRNGGLMAIPNDAHGTVNLLELEKQLHIKITNADGTPNPAVIDRIAVGYGLDEQGKFIFANKLNTHPPTYSADTLQNMHIHALCQKGDWQPIDTSLSLQGSVQQYNLEPQLSHQSLALTDSIPFPPRAPAEKAKFPKRKPDKPEETKEEVVATLAAA